MHATAIIAEDEQPMSMQEKESPELEVATEEANASATASSKYELVTIPNKNIRGSISFLTQLIQSQPQTPVQETVLDSALHYSMEQYFMYVHPAVTTGEKDFSTSTQS